MRFTAIDSTPRATRSVFGLMAAASLLEADLHAPVERKGKYESEGEREEERGGGKERCAGGDIIRNDGMGGCCLVKVLG